MVSLDEAWDEDKELCKLLSSGEYTEDDVAAPLLDEEKTICFLKSLGGANFCNKKGDVPILSEAHVNGEQLLQATL